jgi:hypothetical protein
VPCDFFRSTGVAGIVPCDFFRSTGVSPVGPQASCLPFYLITSILLAYINPLT